MKSLVAAGALLLLGTAMPAQSSVTIVGKSAARACYEAALAQQSSPSALRVCNEAFLSPLSQNDLIATYVNRGIIHSLRRDHLNALSDYDAAIALDPEGPEAFLNKGTLMVRMEGREAEVIQLVSTALAKRTKKPALAYYTRAIAHEHLGNLPAAYKDYLRAAELEPEWELPTQDLKRFRVQG